jgi:hypothetical protein
MTMTLSEKIHQNAYTTNLPYPMGRSDEDMEARRAYRVDQARLDAQFKADVLEDLGLTNHPKADVLWRMAWENGKGSGSYSVYSEAQDLSELLR